MSMAESFAKSAFARFMSSMAGRTIRAAAGLALIWWGYTMRAETTGVVLIVVGLLPLAAGVFNLCYISLLLGGPLQLGRSGGDSSKS